MGVPRRIEESLSFPESLDPALSDVMLPSPGAKDLSRLKEAGWARIGLVAAVLDEQQRVLILTHKPSDKNPANAFGPLAETTQLSHHGGAKMEVESTAHTLSRGIREELGVGDPSSLRLRAKKVGAWLINSWPVGTSYAGQNALAICPVVHLDKDGRETLLDTFAETEEISGITFMPFDEVVTEKLVRPGTHEWLHAVAASRLIDPASAEALVELPEPIPFPDAVDAKFGQINYL